jgi:hypothetical protein
MELIFKLKIWQNITLIMQKFKIINKFYYIINMKLPKRKLKSYFHLIDNNSSPTLPNCIFKKLFECILRT